MRFPKRVYPLIIGVSSLFFYLGINHAAILQGTKTNPSQGLTVPCTYSRTIFMSGQPPTIPAPDPVYSPKMTTLKVEERITYEIAVPEEKVEKGEVTPEDLQLVEVDDKSKITFHQVECFYYRPVTQRQTKTSDALVCTRTRQGTEYWLTNKTRFVDWEAWSDWTTLPKTGMLKKD